MIKFSRFLILVTMFSIFGLLGTRAVSALTFSSDVEVGFTFNPMISISLSSADLVIPELAPGSMADSNEITVTVTTNTAYGYTLNATVGQEDDYETRDLVLDNNGSGSSNSVTAPVFSSLNFGASEATIATDSTWGYAYKTSETNSTWSNYSGLPLYSDNDNVTTLINTDAAAASDYITFKIGARASTTQASGEYKNVINFIAVANPEPQLGPVACEGGKICYNVNALSGTEGAMGQQAKDDSNNDIVDGASVTLLASNYSRAGYGFAGWSDVYDYDINPNAKFYGPNETITVPNGTTTDGLSLYAVWIKSVGYLQNSAVVNTLCGNGSNSLTIAPTDGTANLDSVSALTDQRDDQTYAIAKLADGKCWMIENLRLESTNSDNSTGTLAQGYGTSTTFGNFGGLADAESTNFSNSTTANSLYYSGTQSGTASINIGTINIPGQRMPRYNNLNTTNRATNPTSNTFTGDNTTGGMYSYGNYYTWSAAIANLTSTGTTDSSVTNTSLCPTGWRLPLGNNSTGDIEQGAADAANKVGGFSYLDRKMGGTGSSQSTAAASLRWRTFPNNFLYSGYFNGSSAYNRGSSGNYWSSTAYKYGYSYYLSLRSSYVSPGGPYIDKYYGYSIRCTASAGT